MKRLAATLSLALILLFTGIGYFLSHSQPDQFRPQLQQYLSGIFKQQVELGAISVYRRGLWPVFSAESLILKNPVTGQVLLRAQKARASIRIMPLLGRQIFIERLVLEEAKLSVVRDESGLWNCLPPEFQKNSKEPRAAGGNPWKVRVESFQAPLASVYYADRSQLPYFHQDWELLDISLTQPEVSSYKVTLKPHSKGAILTSLEVTLHSQQLLRVEGDFGPYGRGEGEIAHPFGEARFRGHLKLKNADLKAIPYVRSFISGKAGFQLEADGEGIHPEGIKRSLIVKGSAEIEKGRWLSRNFISETLTALSQLPGFANLTRRSFKGDFYELAEGKDTVFDALRTEFQASNGKVFISNFQVLNPHFRAEGGGDVDLAENRVNFKGNAFFLGAFSAELISRVRDMDVLQNHEGELNVPFAYQGPLSQARAKADLFYIANRLIQTRGQQLASRGIQKLNEFLEAYRS